MLTDAWLSPCKAGMVSKHVKTCACETKEGMLAQWVPIRVLMMHHQTLMVFPYNPDIHQRCWSLLHPTMSNSW
jgi:hypothetical protein